VVLRYKVRGRGKKFDLGGSSKRGGEKPGSSGISVEKKGEEKNGTLSCTGEGTVY